MSTPVPLRPMFPGENPGGGAASSNAAASSAGSDAVGPSQSGGSGLGGSGGGLSGLTGPGIPASRRVLGMKKPLRLGEIAIERFIQGVAFLSLIFITLIFVFIFREAIPLFFGSSEHAVSHEEVGASESYGEVEGEELALDIPELEQSKEPFEAKSLVGAVWAPISLEPKWGLLPLLVGSLKVTFVALLIAGPIGIFAALYTSIFAPKWAREGMKPVIEILAGFPSVVIGFFALVILATVLQQIFGFQYRLNAMLGGVAMSLAVIPIIYTVSEDALAAVPKVLTEASLALGAAKWETAMFVVLPAALPGIFAAVILGFGRAFGETMIVLMATGNAALLTPDLTDPVRTLSATIGAEMAEVVFGDTHYRVLFFLGALLFLISFGLNAIAEFFVRARLLKQFKGS